MSLVLLKEWKLFSRMNQWTLGKMKEEEENRLLNFKLTF